MTLRESLHELRRKIEDAVEHYEKTAPAVAGWLDELYIRLGEDAEAVTLGELLFADSLHDEAGFLHPNFAQNQLVHYIHRTGGETAGLIDH